MIKHLLIICLPLLLIMQLNAGTTGKISGTVTDTETRESLIGVNVILMGTNLGAATNDDGFYVINNIPPGTYTIQFSAIGYQKKQVKNVKIAVDFTTELNTSISSTSIEIETVTIEAEAPLVRKDLTSSHTIVDNTQIEALPVESVDQILALQAGITKDAGGALHIRGGRTNEIEYNVNGVSAINPFDFGRTVKISTNAIQELSVVSGTFNAEYGNALSGVINTVTKEGDKQYKGSLSYYSGDYISSHKDIFNNINDINPVNNQVAEGTLSGPIPFLDNAVTFFVSGRYNNNKGYLYGIREHTIYDSVYRSITNPNDIRISQTGDNSVVSMNPSEDYNITGKFTFRPFSTFKLNYNIIYSNSNWQSYSHDYKYNPDANYHRYEWGLINSLKLDML